MGSIVDNIFIDNLNIMFGEEYLLNTINTIFHDMPPDYKLVMNERLYQEINKNNNDESQLMDTQKKLMLDYLSNLLGDFFKSIRNNILSGGKRIKEIKENKLQIVKNYIKDKVSNIKPKF